MDNVYDDTAKMNVSSHILIRDRNTKQILLNRNVTKTSLGQNGSEVKTEAEQYD